jgi:hypothetical protein
MRPAGGLRQALRDLAPALEPAQAGHAVQGASYLELAHRLHQLAPTLALNPAAPAELRLVKQTVKNMVQAGELQRVGSAHRKGARKALGLYAATSRWSAAALGGGGCGGDALAAAWWGRLA